MLHAMTGPYRPFLMKLVEIHNSSHVSPNAFTSSLIAAFDSGKGSHFTQSADKLDFIILRSLFTSPTERN